MESYCMQPTESVWLLLLSIMHLCFIHGVMVSTVHSFLLLNHIPLSGWIQHNSFIHSPVCSHSGGFLFSVATNKVALSTCHCIGHMLSFLLVKHPGVRWLGRIVRTYLIFQESYYWAIDTLANNKNRTRMNKWEKEPIGNEQAIWEENITP